MPLPGRKSQALVVANLLNEAHQKTDIGRRMAATGEAEIRISLSDGPAVEELLQHLLAEIDALRAIVVSLAEGVDAL